MGNSELGNLEIWVKRDEFPPLGGKGGKELGILVKSTGNLWKSGEINGKVRRKVMYKVGNSQQKMGEKDWNSAKIKVGKTGVRLMENQRHLGTSIGASW